MVMTGDYPEYRELEWKRTRRPAGHRPAPQAASLGNVGVAGASGAGRFYLGLVQRVETGLAWSAVGNINPRAYVVNPGYLTPPTSVQYYFSARGDYRTDTVSATDAVAQLVATDPGTKRGQGFVRAVLINAFNRAAAIRVNTTVLTRNDSAA